MAASALGRTAAPFAPRVSPRSPAPASAARAKKRPAEEIRRAGNFDELLRRHPRQDRRQAQAPAGGSAIARSPRRWGAAVLATPERPHTRFSGHRRRSEHGLQDGLPEKSPRIRRLSARAWRRGRDSNPRSPQEGQRFSRPPRSTAPAPLP
jgi:hypothetical protein